MSNNQKDVNVFLISNMYPTTKFPVFGVFVKNTEFLLNKYSIKTILKSVISGRKSRFSKLLSYFNFYISIVANFYNQSIDIIYVHFPLQSGPLIYFLSFFTKKKIVLNIHGSELKSNSLFKLFLRKNLLNADLVVVPSNYFKKKLISEYSLIESNIYVYPSGGINFSAFKPLNKNLIKGKYQIETEKFICSYISTISNAKGWKTFLEASELLIRTTKNIEFLVVGNGPQENEFKNSVRQKGMEKFYHFFDRQEQNRLVEFYNCSDVFIFPSHSESLGLVALEALACGVPVIAPNNAPFNEYIVDGYNGYLFNLKDANSLVNKIEHLISSGREDEIEKNAIESSKKYENNFVSEKLAKRLKKLM